MFRQTFFWAGKGGGTCRRTRKLSYLLIQYAHHHKCLPTLCDDKIQVCIFNPLHCDTRVKIPTLEVGFTFMRFQPPNTQLPSKLYGHLIKYLVFFTPERYHVKFPLVVVYRQMHLTWRVFSSFFVYYSIMKPVRHVAQILRHPGKGYIQYREADVTLRLLSLWSSELHILITL